MAYEQIHSLEDDTVQSIWIKGGFRKSKPIYYCHGYREHHSRLGGSLKNQRDYLEIFLKQWEDALTHDNQLEVNEVHIAGDMNVDVLHGRWLESDYHLLSLSNMIRNTCNIGNFMQLVEVPTRAQFNQVQSKTDISCLDHVYTNFQYRCSKVSVEIFGGSDHDLIGYTRFSKQPPTPAQTIRKRSYLNFVQDDFLRDLKLVDWTAVYQCQEVDLATEVLTEKFRGVLDLHAPWKVYQVRKHFIPWLSDDTKKFMKLRDDWKCKALEIDSKNGDSSQAWAEFKRLRNRVNNRRKYEEIKYKREKLSSVSLLADTWQMSKSFMDWKTGSGPPEQLCVNGKLITKASEIASTMNCFFIEKVGQIRDGIAYIPNTLTACSAIMGNKRCQLSAQFVSRSYVNKLLKKIKVSKSISIDQLDSYSIKIAADIITDPLHHLITLSLMQQRFPSSWKLSKVTPLHKKGSKLERKNYRPVSILSPFSKILEKVVYMQLYRYFSFNKIFDKGLHGYRHGRSTQTALLCMYDRWVKNAAKGDLNGVVFLDLSAAFDLVEPQLLIQKLEIYGIQNDMISWIKSYLDNRFQAVWVNHTLSDFIESEVGVPQGSILGPLLFIIFFNDLPRSLNCSVESYADDTTLTGSGSIENIEVQLNNDCSTVSHWMRANKLKLNPDKTHILLVGTQQRINSLDTTINVVIDGITLQEDPSRMENLLGCKIQANLKWNKQIETLLVKLKSRLSCLMKIRYSASFETRKMLTEGVFNSVLLYCLPVFGGCDVAQLKDLQIMQNKAAQVVCNMPNRSNRDYMFDKLGWLSVNQMVCYTSILEVFKIRYNMEPEYLYEIFSKENRLGKIIVPFTRLELARRSFTYRAASLWNRLPVRIRSLEKSAEFKNHLKLWVMANCPRFHGESQ